MRKTNMSDAALVGVMDARDAARVSDVVRGVISTTMYYNARARREEKKKYTRAALLDAAKSDPYSVIVAKVAREVVGFCISKYDDGLIWLSWFGVRDDWRRRGIGMALLRALQRTARARRCHKMWCDCRTSNRESKPVLKRFGFRRICLVKNHWYGQDFVLWEKPIRP